MEKHRRCCCCVPQHRWSMCNRCGSSNRNRNIFSAASMHLLWILFVVEAFRSTLDASPRIAVAYSPLRSRIGFGSRRSSQLAALHDTNGSRCGGGEPEPELETSAATTTTTTVLNMNSGLSSRKHWASSLPLPEHAPDPSEASRSRAAMEGPNPPALEGRCPVDLGFSGIKWLHVDPPVLIVDDFLTAAECSDVLSLTGDRLPPDAGRVIKIQSRVGSAPPSSTPPPPPPPPPSTKSNTNTNTNTKTKTPDYSEQQPKKQAAAAAGGTNNPAQRSSTTWYVRYGCGALAPIFHNLEGLLPALDRTQIEEVQLVRYAGSGQGFSWHEDALDESTATPEAGGQRVATVLVYLDDVVPEEDGTQTEAKTEAKTKTDRDAAAAAAAAAAPSTTSGRTLFRDLLGPNGKPLGVAPKRGRALLFFPAVREEAENTTASTTTADDDHNNDDDDDDDDNGCAFGPIHPWDNTRADRRTVHAGEPPGDGGASSSAAAAATTATKHIAQIWIHSAPHTPVVFGRGLNPHGDAQKHIDELRAARRNSSSSNNASSNTSGGAAAVEPSRA